MATRTRQNCKLVYPQHDFAPEELLHFVETRFFTESWSDMKFDVEDDLLQLQIGLMAHPKSGSVIPDTKGLRKLRFSFEDGGKRGGCRVCYKYFEKHHVILLLMAYPKSEKDDITSDEKKAIRLHIMKIDRYLEEKSVSIDKTSKT